MNKKTELKFYKEEDNANANKKPVTRGRGIPYQIDKSTLYQLYIIPTNNLQDQSNPTHESIHVYKNYTK